MKTKHMMILLGLMLMALSGASWSQPSLQYHYVGGKILNPDDSAPAAGDIQIYLYLSRAPHIISNTQFCATGGGWAIDVQGTAPISEANWVPGDTVVIVFEVVAEGPFQGHQRIIRHVTVEDSPENLGNIALPVELTAFTATIKSTSLADQVLLEWRTVGETNNLGFEVQRSLDKKNFARLGFIAGAGSTNIAQGYSYVDETAAVGTWFYRLKQIDRDGSFTFSEVKGIEVMPPQKYELTQNFPNPFNPRTEIAFHVRQEGVVELKVFDLLGREVRTLVNERMRAGIHRVTFDGRDLPSGMYLYTIKAGNFHAVKKMLLVK